MDVILGAGCGAVGVTDGIHEGIGVGCAEGEVGRADGDNVLGPAVGVSILGFVLAAGCDLGCVDGSVLVITEGFIVGSIDGMGVGFSDGWFVGF